MSDLEVIAPQNARAAAILVHGHEASKEWGFFPWLGEQLCDERIAAVRFTMNGDSYVSHVREVVEVIDHVQSHYRHLPIFLLGHSLGGAVALIAATETDAVAGVITWSAISRGDGMDVIDYVPRIDVPLLAIHGSNDAHISPEESRRLVERASDASLLMIDGASHTYNAIHPLVYVPRALRYAATVSASFIAAYA